MRPLELYIHIPFCIKKCRYCDFLSAPSTEKERESYVENLCRKIYSYEKLSKNYFVVSIFAGGGTPSILEAGQMKTIFDAVRSVFQVEADAEITIEMNPGTVTRKKLKEYKDAGVNRLSIGLQSADNKELAALGRIHTCEEFFETFRMAREEGFQNINIDLMSAIPFQSVKSWERTLRTAAELEPEHISAYSLIIEEGTPFYERYSEGRHAEELPDEDEERLMYQNTKKILEGYGYRRYEISNYARPGYECRHNLGYWSRTEYLGIGAGAASLIENQRWTEDRHIQSMQFDEPSEAEKKRRTKGEEIKIQTLSLQEQMEEYMFLGLRKMKGVSKSRFESEFGRSMDEVYGAVIEEMTGRGLLEKVKEPLQADSLEKEKGYYKPDGLCESEDETDEYVRLTEKGIDVSNWVMSEFLL